MAVSHVTTTVTNNSETSTDTVSISTAAVIGDLIELTVAFRNFGANTFTSPAWNGVSMTLVGSSNGIGVTFATYSCIANASTTANVTGTLDTFLLCNASVTVFRGSGSLTISAFAPLLYESGTYVAPSIVSTSVPTGAMVYSVLNGTDIDESFSPIATLTWSIGSPSTLRGSAVNTSNSRLHALLVGTGAGAGANYTSSWAASTGAPQYSQMVFVVSDAPATSIDSITTAGNPGLVIGQPFNIATSNLGTLAEIDIQTIGVLGSTVVATSLSAPSGDGTATMPYWVNGQKYPKIGTARVTAVETGGTPNTAYGDFTLNLPATYIMQTFASVLLPDATWLGYVLNAISHPLADNDRAHWPDVNGLTFGADSKISVTLADGATMVTDLWIQKVDSTMEYYSLTINSSGSASITKNNRLWIGIGLGI